MENFNKIANKRRWRCSQFKNLTRAYKQSTDNNKRTGATQCNVPFADLMDDIFGDSPTISNNHSINLYGQPLEKQQQETNNENSSNNESTAANLPSTTKKPRAYRPPLKEKISLMKIKCKKALSANKIQIFEEYAAKNIEKMEQAQLLNHKVHEEKMAMLKDFIDAKK